MATADANLLVLGVGGNVSAGIVKALVRSSNHYRIFGGCVSTHSSGLYMCDHALLSPLANDPRFFDWLVDTCNRYEIQGVLCGVEEVLTKLAEVRSELEKRTSARVIVASSEKLAICRDKLVTARWLEENGLNAPQSVEASDQEGIAKLRDTHGFPCFAKPRFGKSSQGVMPINTESELAAVSLRRNYVVQQHVGSDDAEYTAATLGDRDGIVQGCIVILRQLVGGTTVSAEVVEDVAVRDQVLAIASALKPVGPCNMQMRKEAGEAVCFEINLRYSGSAPMRAHFGFNDVDAGVRHLILGEEAQKLPHVTEGAAVRYWNEAYLEPQAFHEWKSSGSLAIPADHVKTVERFGRKL